MAERKNGVMELTETERKILTILRSVQFGEVRIIITDNKPVRIEEIKRSIKL